MVAKDDMAKKLWEIRWVIVCVCCVVALVALTTNPRWQFWAGRGKPPGAKVVIAGGPVAGSSERSLAELEGWAPQDFFEEREAIAACDAIAAQDEPRLRALIDAGLDVNLTGKSGMTLLDWAYVNDNFAAFQLLLESGADPSKKLTRHIVLRTQSPLRAGDSILFTCLRTAMKRSQLDFFFAALDHTSEDDPRDAANNTLLHLAVTPWESNGGELVLPRLIEFGVDLNALDKYGDTAAMSAVNHDRPHLALLILEAGADPTIRNEQGQTVAERLRQKIRLDQQQEIQFLPPEQTEKLLEWLEKKQQ